MKVSVPLEKSYRLLNHGPVTLVSAADENEQNLSNHLNDILNAYNDTSKPQIKAKYIAVGHTPQFYDDKGNRLSPTRFRVELATAQYQEMLKEEQEKELLTCLMV